MWRMATKLDSTDQMHHLKLELIFTASEDTPTVPKFPRHMIAIAWVTIEINHRNEETFDSSEADSFATKFTWNMQMTQNVRTQTQEYASLKTNWFFRSTKLSNRTLSFFLSVFLSFFHSSFLSFFFLYLFDVTKGQNG